jgi:transcriptional regulator with XRE-family HTH domain
MDHRRDVQDFLSSRRARLTPEQAGLAIHGDRRRVKGLRREEVATLAGVSVDYCARLERGNLAGASESVLEALARALNLARYVFLEPGSRGFFLGWDTVADDLAGALRVEVARDPPQPAALGSDRGAVHPQRGVRHSMGSAERAAAPHCP